MSTNVTVQNDITYLFIQAMGWDYNFWTVIFSEGILIVGFFVIVTVAFFIYVALGGK